MKHNPLRQHTNRFPALSLFWSVVLLAGCWLLALFSAPALALRSDTRMPIHIESEQQALDIQHNIVTFTGNVVLTQGSIKIHADKIVVTRPDGTKGQEVIDGYGTPATFYQKQDNGKPIEGHAGHMHYEVARQRVVLTGNALLKQLDSSIASDQIIYLVPQQKMTAISNSGKRVTTVLLPSQLQDNPPDDGKTPPVATSDR